MYVSPKTLILVTLWNPQLNSLLISFHLTNAISSCNDKTWKTLVSQRIMYLIFFKQIPL